MSQLNEQWAKVLEILKGEMPSESFDNWVPPLVPSSFENNKITLLTPHSFTAFTLKTSYSEVITKALAKVFGETVSFDIIYDKNLEENYVKQQKKAQKEEKKQTLAQFAENKYDGLKQMQSDCNLNTKYKFENFVVGEYNKLAYGAALAVAEGKKKFNPLYIYGGSGLGKTHLMQAIGNYILFKGKGKVKYITLDNFVNDLIENLLDEEKDSFKKGSDTNKKMTKFRQKYRNIDVLLIDDIQFIEGKKRTKTELFNIFNELHLAGKQIVITSDRLPSEIKGIEERLKTRFEWGLMVDIGTPDIETRMKILKQLSDNEEKYHLKWDVIEFLATVYKNNIRELEGAFNKVCAHCSFYGEEPTMETVKKAIKYNSIVNTINGLKIVEETAKFYGLKTEDICGSSRIGKIAYARKVAIYIIRELTGESWQSIGDILGGRKHTTTMYACKEVTEDIVHNKKLSDEINTLFNIINQI